MDYQLTFWWSTSLANFENVTIKQSLTTVTTDARCNVCQYLEELQHITQLNPKTEITTFTMSVKFCETISQLKNKILYNLTQ
jgi:hypothetical protein